MEELRRELGVPVILVDYPGYGRSGGSPSEAGCLRPPMPLTTG